MIECEWWVMIVVDAVIQCMWAELVLSAKNAREARCGGPWSSFVCNRRRKKAANDSGTVGMRDGPSCGEELSARSARKGWE